ncbi:mucin-3A [Anopheles nili]|uniref:mucin-3A n=1 Tax=Anopheles nili TaxID=185578 RepID=UPI00237AA94F|nr:mucin-3A [Anopheles nili]
MQPFRIATFLPVLLLLFLVTLTDGWPYPRPMPQNLRRLPRRNDFVAYNLHRIIRPRDVNDLDVDQARKAMHDVHETIAEVQRLLALDPTLPRLTRGEIEELFENVTREEFSKSLRAGDHHRAQHMRALMLVLPYHANNMSPDNLQKIYTRPPVTRIVAAPTDMKTASSEPLPITPARLIATTSTTPAGPRTTTPPIPVTTIRFTTPRPTTFHPTLPERMRGVGLRKEELNDILASLGLSQSLEELQTPPTFRPMPTTTTTVPPPTTTRAPVTTTERQHRPLNNAIAVDDPKAAKELKDLLRSFGLLKEEPLDVAAPLLPQPERLVDIQPAALVLHEPLKVEEPSTPAAIEPSHPSVEPEAVNIKPGSGGLTQASVKPDDYIAFKPLTLGDSTVNGDGNTSGKQLDEELNALLQSFGLLGPGSRNKKSMTAEPTSTTIATTSRPPTTTATTVMKAVPAIDADLVAPQLLSVLGTLGIQMRQQQQPSPSPAALVRRREKTPRKLDPPTEETPSALVSVRNEDYRKLEQLWQTVKQLEQLNVNLTGDSLDVLHPKHYDLSPSLLAQGPDPVDVAIDTNERLNEIKKRQEPGTTTESNDGSEVTDSDSPTRFSLQLNTTGGGGGGTTSEDVELLGPSTTTAATATVERSTDEDTTEEGSSSTSSTSTTTTTESARSAALADSFPSSDLAGDPVNEEPLPPPRRNGFYFLYDWNTFLEVGEDPNKVIIRYNPRAGDPSRFLPVTVP